MSLKYDFIKKCLFSVLWKFEILYQMVELGERNLHHVDLLSVTKNSVRAIVFAKNEEMNEKIPREKIFGNKNIFCKILGESLP